MNSMSPIRKSQPAEPKRRRRVIPAILGFAGSGILLFVGSSGHSRFALWIFPCVLPLMVIVLLVAQRMVPRFASWFQAGITLLLAAIVGAVVLFAGIAVLVFSSFATEYAPGYSASAFKTMALGDTRESVLSKLGEPLSSNNCQPFTQWIYSADDQPRFSDNGIGEGTHTTVTFGRDECVRSISGQRSTAPNSITVGDGANYLGLKNEDIKKWIGSTPADIRKAFGTPAAVYHYNAATVLSYSRSPSSSHYYLRSLGIDDEGKVVHIWRSIYWD